MILACSSCVFDVISSVGGSYLFPVAITIGSVLILTIGSMLMLYNFFY